MHACLSLNRDGALLLLGKGAAATATAAETLKVASRVVKVAAAAQAAADAASLAVERVAELPRAAPARWAELRREVRERGR